MSSRDAYWYKDVCEVRNFFDLGCEGCVLNGTGGCPGSHAGGKEPPGQGLSDIGSGRVKTIDGYELHLPGVKGI
jgi:hypothetical protein